MCVCRLKGTSALADSQLMLGRAACGHERQVASDRSLRTCRSRSTQVDNVHAGSPNTANRGRGRPS